MISGVDIRRSMVEDAPRIAPLLGQLGYPTSPDVLATRMSRAGEADPSWVAVDDETMSVAGFAAGHLFTPLELDGPVSEMTALVVDETARRLRLLQGLLEGCRACAEALRR